MKRKNGKDREIRTFESIEMRVERAEGESPKIVGHAAVFDSPTTIGKAPWGFTEEVAPGAFKESIANDDIRGLFNHEPSLILGRNKAGTMTLEEDDKGLKYEIIPPDTTVANDLLESIERGDITGSSFAFDVKKEEWEITGDEQLDKRRLITLALWDVSPVTFPAYDDTDVAKRKYRESRAKAGLPNTEPIEDLENRPKPEKEKKNNEPQPENSTGNRDKMGMRLRLTD